MSNTREAVVYYGQWSEWKSSHSHWVMGTGMWINLNLHMLPPHPGKRKEHLIRRWVLQKLFKELRYAALLKNRKPDKSGIICYPTSLTESDFDHALIQLPLLLKAPNTTFKVRT